MSNGWFVTTLCATRSSLQGITTDNKGCIYCTSRDRVWKIDLNETKQEIICSKDSRFCGIVWNNNFLYICDQNCKGDRILMYSLDTGILSTLIGEEYSRRRKDGTFKRAATCGPNGIAVDKNGDLYISESESVRKINLSQGTVITVADLNGVCWKPEGIAVSEDGSIYVADWDNQCIQKIKDGVVSKAGTPDNPSDLFEHPSAIVVLANGNLVVGDSKGLKSVNNNQQLISSLDTAKPIRGMCAYGNGDLIVAISRKLYKLEPVWKYERYLWIGWLKEEAIYCPLATLPRDIIKEIAGCLPSTSHAFHS